MKDRILHDPSFSLGLAVWAVAATLFPLQLGIAGATLAGLIGYLAIAGMLLAVADALLHPAAYHRIGDVALQSVLWMIGLALPALLLFSLGGSLAPAAEAFEDDLCQLSGMAHVEGYPEAAIEEALEPTEECESPA